MISIAACSIGSDLPDTEEGSLTENSMKDTGHADVEGNPPAESDAQDAERTEPESDGGAYIILNMNGTDIHARLYDNTAAGAFLDLLPYTVTVSRATEDLCGSVSGELEHAEEIGLGSRDYNLVNIDE